MSRFIIDLNRAGEDRKGRIALTASVREVVGDGPAAAIVSAGTMSEGSADDLCALLRIMFEDSEAMQGQRKPFGCSVAWPGDEVLKEAAELAALPF